MNVRQAEEAIRHQQFETALAWSLEGGFVLEKDGTHTSVSFEDDEILLLKGAIFTHNHPHGLEFAEDDPRSFGNSFSLQDLRLACYAELAEIRAVTPWLRFSLKPPALGWSFDYWTSVMEPVYLRHKVDISRELRQQFASGTLTSEQASAAYFHEICSRVAYDLGLEYTREEN